MSDPAPRLPARPSLEQLRKQAKDLLHAFRAGAEAAVQRVRTVITQSVNSAPASELTLADIQFVLAREHGFESWAKLVHHIETPRPAGIAKYERLADEIARAYMAGDAETIRDLNAMHGMSFVWDSEPERTQSRLTQWYASESRAPEIALARGHRWRYARREDSLRAARERDDCGVNARAQINLGNSFDQLSIILQCS